MFYLLGGAVVRIPGHLWLDNSALGPKIPDNHQRALVPPLVCKEGVGWLINCQGGMLQGAVAVLAAHSHLSESCLKENVVMSDTENRVRGIIVELLGVNEEQVIDTARFREDLEADSLDLVELIMAFEEEFEGEISDEEAQKITTVGEAVTYIDSHMRE